MYSSLITFTVPAVYHSLLTPPVHGSLVSPLLLRAHVTKRVLVVGCSVGFLFCLKYCPVVGNRDANALLLRPYDSPNFPQRVDSADIGRDTSLVSRSTASGQKNDRG